LTTSLQSLLQNQIDITRVPFSDRGSRLLVYQYPGQDRLYLKLAERLICLDPALEAYVQRPPLVEDLVFVDGLGEALAFTATTSAHLIRFHTRIGEFALAFQDIDTLALSLPPNSASGLRFRVQDLGGVRQVTCSTNGTSITRAPTSPSPNTRTIEEVVRADSDSVITLHVGDPHHRHHAVRSFSAIQAAAEARWRNWFDQLPEVGEPFRQKYAYAWWVIANNLVSPFGSVTHESVMPSKALYVGIWQWDSALHTVALRHADLELAHDQLRVMLAHQLPDGMLPDVVFDEGIVTELDHPFRAHVTKPPLLAWAAAKMHSTNPDLDFLHEIYPSLVRCVNWWFEQNDDDADGLVQYGHPYSSGLDNSPLWDHGMPVESPDINTYLCIEMDSLAALASALSNHDDAGMWRRRSQSLVQLMVEDMWDKDAGLFHALRAESPVPVVTPFQLYPLWTGRLPRSMARQLIYHLRDSDEFWGDRVLPTVARNDPSYDPEAMWRGPIWCNINYFFIEALQRVGAIALARELRDKTLKLIMESPGISEYYNPDNGKPGQHAAPMFSWSAAVFIDLALQATAESGVV